MVRTLKAVASELFLQRHLLDINIHVKTYFYGFRTKKIKNKNLKEKLSWKEIIEILFYIRLFF